MDDEITNMTVNELALFVLEHPEESQRREGEIKDALSGLCWKIGLVWDALDGTDVREGPERRFGSRNHKSMTYKLRKVAGYSYP